MLRQLGVAFAVLLSAVHLSALVYPERSEEDTRTLFSARSLVQEHSGKPFQHTDNFKRPAPAPGAAPAPGPYSPWGGSMWGGQNMYSNAWSNWGGLGGVDAFATPEPMIATDVGPADQFQSEDDYLFRYDIGDLPDQLRPEEVDDPKKRKR
eukprot:gnl/MRDRNA2_/MRDRNA2_90834_c0_seq1.p1 gnl/MRDRNA2_/MRDRNA2_90834_c0~~gnl/MRDRNA2_/MRDRNA2_90834_c0_seq1.p1  ORF type:complete len:151 (+),score=18.78 gnl/MRDRNA2_/MRDRNA2_90834_c0_seq1:125-577(+)